VFLSVFKKKHKHSFIISNAFVTLEDQNQVDVIKSCINCSIKEVFSVDRVTLLELIDLYPHAFDPLLKEYLNTWKN
jgi:hypothetical protein